MLQRSQTVGVGREAQLHPQQPAEILSSFRDLDSGASQILDFVTEKTFSMSRYEAELEFIKTF